MEKVTLDDLAPTSCKIELNGNLYTVKKFSLMSQIWVKGEYGSLEKWSESLDPKSKINQDDELNYFITVIKTLHHLLDDEAKQVFPTWQKLGESIGMSSNELSQVQKVIAIALGASQPMVEKIDQEVKKKVRELVAEKVAGLQ